MDNAKQHWEILQKLGTHLPNKIREFMVIGGKGEGVIVITEDGLAYWFGDMCFGFCDSITADEPTLLDVPELVQMAQSFSHILLLSKRGELYSMGENDHGQLGLGTIDDKIHFSPQLISSPYKFTSVRCSDWHSLALTEDGRVCGWGWNYYGQIGVSSSTESIPSLHQISQLNHHRIVAVECGGLFSLALTDQGVVYAWGCNDGGQLI